MNVAVAAQSTPPEQDRIARGLAALQRLAKVRRWNRQQRRRALRAFRLGVQLAAQREEIHG